MCQLVHMRFASEMIGCRRQRAIGSLPQRRIGGVESNSLMRHFIGRAHSRGPRIVVVKLPEQQSAVGLRAAFDIHNAGGTEISPGEFLFARPHQLDGTSRAFRQARCLNRCFAGMFTSIGRTSIGNDDPNLGFGNMQGARQFLTYRKRALSSGPDRELVSLPLRNCGARLERNMRDISYRVAPLESFRSLGTDLV